MAGLTLCAAAALWAGCTGATRHKVLTALFDGVPPREVAVSADSVAGAAAPGEGLLRSIGYQEHGPYAARLCQACHQAEASNALVAPADQLCFQCHHLDLGKKFVHGPLAAGGCLVCHDPHSSRYGSLLVSASDSFCNHCHEPGSIAPIAAHEGATGRCTACHDAHMSDNEHLLR